MLRRIASGAVVCVVTMAGASYCIPNAVDVSVSSTAKVVEHSVAASPVNPSVLLLASRRPAAGDCTTWISFDCGQTWGSNQAIESGSSDPRTAIGNGGTDGWFYANYNWHYGVQNMEDVKIGRKATAAASWSNPPQSPRTILDADGGQDMQGGINNHLWVDNYATNTQDRLFVAYQERLGWRIRMKRSGDQGFTWLSSLIDGDYVDHCLMDGCAEERRNVCLHTGSLPVQTACSPRSS